MYDIALLLHIYQPPTQFPEVTKEIAETSYRPLVRVLKETTSAKLALNICASLTEQLDKLGYHNLLGDFKKLAQEGKVEFMGSAKYHPLLSKLPPGEIKHQISLNQETNERLLGSVFKPQGFFPPEMAYSSHVARAIEQTGFSWVIVEDFAFPDGKIRRHDCIYRVAGTGLKVVFRDRHLSLGLAFGDFKTPRDFMSALERGSNNPSEPRSGNEGYRIIALDGETFGHHHPEAVRLLRGLLELRGVNWQTISEIIEKYGGREEEVEVLPSTWG